MTRSHFLQSLRVPASAIDMNGHANNVEVVRWLQDVAMAHSAACGWPLQRYAQQGSTWVVRSHFVEYLRPAMQDDDLLLATWIARFDKNLSPRKTLVWRPRDRKLLVNNAEAALVRRIFDGFVETESCTKLVQALRTPEVKKFILDKYKGAVVPVF